MRLIDADALPLERYGEEVISWYATGWNDAIDAINRAPSVDAEPVRHGKWENYPSHTYRRCSICKKTELDKPKFNTRSNYCPNCGAKMDGGVKEWQE